MLVQPRQFNSAARLSRPIKQCCCRLIHGMTGLEIFIVKRRRAVEVFTRCRGRPILFQPLSSIDELF